MRIDSNFDSGNIDVVELVSPRCVRLELVPDPGTDYLHWFCFRGVLAPGEPHSFHIVNAGEGRVAATGWPGYRALASYDRQTWFRLPTTYKSGVLSFTLTPEHPVVYFAHFPPYSLERHADRLANYQMRGAEVRSIGASVENRSIDLVQIGREGPALWITSGQHPGEHMGPWFTEGLLEHLLGDDPLAAELRGRARFFIVPTANPDGSVQGRLRTNAASVDLNRAWRNTHNAPEIAAIIAQMERHGCDFQFDVHGDESNQNVFIINSDSVPGIDPAIIERRKRFEIALENTGAGFRRGHGPKQEAPGTANLDIGANFVTHRFRCLALTLEMPFKDPAHRPFDAYGWSPRDCRALGAATLDAIHAILGEL